MYVVTIKRALNDNYNHTKYSKSTFQNMATIGFTH